MRARVHVEQVVEEGEQVAEHVAAPAERERGDLGEQVAGVAEVENWRSANLTGAGRREALVEGQKDDKDFAADAATSAGNPPRALEFPLKLQQPAEADVGAKPEDFVVEHVDSCARTGRSSRRLQGFRAGRRCCCRARSASSSRAAAARQYSFRRIMVVRFVDVLIKGDDGPQAAVNGADVPDAAVVGRAVVDAHVGRDLAVRGHRGRAVSATWRAGRRGFADLPAQGC